MRSKLTCGQPARAEERGASLRHCPCQGYPCESFHLLLDSSLDRLTSSSSASPAKSETTMSFRGSPAPSRPRPESVYSNGGGSELSENRRRQTKRDEVRLLFSLCSSAGRVTYRLYARRSRMNSRANVRPQREAGSRSTEAKRAPCPLFDLCRLSPYPNR